MTDQEIVRLEDATRVYQQGKVEVRAVDGLSFQVTRGDFADLRGRERRPC